MSRKIDYSKPLSDDDKAWLIARGWGNRIPGNEAHPSSNVGPVIDPNASAEDQLKNQPNTGTATGTLGAVEERPEDGYTEDDYASWKVADLKAEIDERNEERDDDHQISSEGKKADLVAALVADDEAQPTAGNGD